MSRRLIAKIHEGACEPIATRLLAFDPTPAGLVGKRSLRLAFKYHWKLIRDRHFKENSASCMLCHVTKTKPEIDAHEIYSFPNPQVVRLDRILFVCKYCHDAIHLERTRIRCLPEYIRFIEDHYCKINGVSENDRLADFGHMSQRSFVIREFYGGANATPTLDFGPYQNRIDEFLKRKLGRPEGKHEDDSDFEMYPDHECPWDIGKAD